MLLLTVLFALVLVGRLLSATEARPRVLGDFFEFSYVVNVKLFRVNVKLIPSLTVRVLDPSTEGTNVPRR